MNSDALPSDERASAGMGRFEGPEGTLFVAVVRSSNLRDLRSALVGSAYALDEADSADPPGDPAPRSPAHALCVVIESRLTQNRIDDEIAQFRAVLTNRLAERVHATAVSERQQPLSKLPPVAPPSAVMAFVHNLIRSESAANGARTRITRQAIKALMLEQFARGRGFTELNPRSVLDLQRASGASYPTVAKVLAELSSTASLSRDGRIGLSRPSAEMWQKTAEAYAGERRTKRYVDPTGNARPPHRMLARLNQIREQRVQRGEQDLAEDISVGGVLGATMHYADLDVTAAPRLDLCLHGGDDSFVRELDAGLKESDDPHARPVLVLHTTWDMRREQPGNPQHRARARLYAPHHGAAIGPASIVDCYADLLEMEYGAEARDFAVAIAKRSG